MYGLTATQRPDEGAVSEPERNIDGLITTLASPVLDRLVPAAARLQPLNAATLADLDCAISLQLGQRLSALRRQLAAMQDAAAAEQALRAAIDLPMALRRAVHVSRGGAGAGEAA